VKDCVCMLYLELTKKMGIRGLTSFIDDHPELLTDFHLHDTCIVIDGNNLYHFLYYYFHVPCEYGGDYNQFARYCDAFFTALHSCNITPYVVFDGAHAANGNKFETSLARARERVHMSNIVAHGRRAKILPILTHSCFVRVLQRLGIEYVTCDFEADCQIAALARRWNCPVLTNDSDFFIYDIPAGVILLDYLNLRCKVPHAHPKHHSEVVKRYLDVQIFYCQKFMKFLHVHNHSLVVLFATLLGNDIVDGRNFENFFSQIKIPKTRNYSKSSNRHRRIAGLISWLQSVSSASDAVAYILAKLPQNHRKRVESLIELSLDCYCEPQSDLHEYFDVENSRKKYAVRTFGECILPDWFLVSISRGTIPSAMLNILASRRLLLLSQIEASPEVSSYRCSQKLRQIAYGIALSVNNSPTDCSSSQAACVNEFDRECKTLKMCSVEPTFQVNGKSLPCLTQVSQIDRRQRFLLLLESLDTSSVDRVSDLMIPDAQFLVAVLRFWIRHASAKVSSLHIHALLMCCLKLGALDSYFLIAQSKTVAESVCQSTRLLETKKSQLRTFSDLTATDDDEDSDVFATMLKALTQGLDICTDGPSDNAVAEDSCKCEINKVKEKLFWLDSAPHHNHAMTFNSSIVYAFAEFQTTFMSAACIANMLGLMVHDPASVFSGTVLYNLMRELRSRSNPDMYVTELLGGSLSVLSSCYFQLMSVVLTDLPEGCLEVVGCRQKKKGKKGKKTSCKMKSDEPESCLEEEQIVDGSEEHYVLNCDVDNRFSSLSFTEE